ncbi:hypothetical protein D5071_13420 [Pectobacterium carotovorum]|uniref:Uncharacterized protein n=1 Tax=Pectobacterium carotovorum TaxID=554 RepID=A0A419AV07_PECCA|nr:hypothetical protein D5071_13420 [Pectobacterium carotovorum]
MCVGYVTQCTGVHFAPLGPLQAAFKSAKADLSVTRITYLSKLIGIPSLAAFLQLELFSAWLVIKGSRLMNRIPEKLCVAVICC